MEKISKGQSLHQQKLLSPTENTAPEALRQLSPLQMRDFVTKYLPSAGQLSLA